MNEADKDIVEYTRNLLIERATDPAVKERIRTLPKEKLESFINQIFDDVVEKANARSNRSTPKGD